MNVLCPGCLKRVAVPNEAAGKPTPCPACGHTFTPPALTPAALDAAHPTPPKGPTMEPTSSPPPVPTPAAPPPPRPSAAPPPPAPPSLEGGPCCTCTLSLRWTKWLAPVAFLVIFVLSFFPWVGSYPNGTAVYTQSAWKAMRGAFKVVNPTGDDQMQKHEALDKNGRVNGLLLIYCLLLIPVAALSAGVIATNLMTFTMPDALKRPWEMRDVVLGVLSIVLPGLLVIPLLLGFGLESAAASAAEEKVPAVAAAADGTQPKAKDLEIREMRRDVEVGTYALQRTCWLYLVLLAHAVALFGIVATLWLYRRGGQPEPRAEFYS